MNNNLSSRFTFKGNNMKIKINNVVKPLNHSIDSNKSKTKTKQMEWGTVTWVLFHWIAANINEELYIKMRIQLHSIIKNILYNLPCPICKGHAMEFTKTHDINKCINKAQFIEYFYFFHNKVNERKNYAIQEHSILNTYTTMNGIDVINEWVQKFKNNLGINLNDFMNKQNISDAKNNMINFIKANKKQFTNL